MPLIEVTLVAGRPPEQLRALITRLTEAAEAATGAPRGNIRVILREVPAAHWAAGDVTIQERDEEQP
ncbi:2-hydroxymuconate tautomerase [Actinomadura luteofluorescens]|uniref:2-hydroxymuconate tautomerase n=1 Tax=Actinomadura luteofluorescens TaxID=46163 RepID=UPI003476B210